MNFNDKAMGNPFINLVNWAAENNICVNYPCTTCGANTFRTELRRLNITNKEGLVKAVIEADLLELITLPNWIECLQYALNEIMKISVKQCKIILKEWLSRPVLPIRFLDYLLYDFIRGVVPKGSALWNSWINRCIAESLKTKDESLTESIIWVLRSDVTLHEVFCHFANELACDSPVIALALRKTLKAELPAVAEDYVASRNSAVFHRSDCKSALEISKKKMTQYATRDEAIQAGKKPCAECQP